LRSGFSCSIEERTETKRRRRLNQPSGNVSGGTRGAPKPVKQSVAMLVLGVDVETFLSDLSSSDGIVEVQM
jgi:hypothetical protein